MEVSPFSNAMLVYCCMKTRAKLQSRMNFIFIIKVISLLVPIIVVRHLVPLSVPFCHQSFFVQLSSHCHFHHHHHFHHSPVIVIIVVILSLSSCCCCPVVIIQLSSSSCHHHCHQYCCHCFTLSSSVVVVVVHVCHCLPTGLCACGCDG